MSARVSAIVASSSTIRIRRRPPFGIGSSCAPLFAEPADSGWDEIDPIESESCNAVARFCPGPLRPPYPCSATSSLIFAAKLASVTLLPMLTYDALESLLVYLGQR